MRRNSHLVHYFHPIHLVFGLACAGVAIGTGAQEMDCGDPFHNNYGPFDYYVATQKQRETVENFHFTEDVATLRHGASTYRIGADIAYTLRVFPNHPRALMAMTALARRDKTDRPEGSQYSLECWFVRAMQFRPNDAAVRTLYGIALSEGKKYQDALKQFSTAAELDPKNANIEYNLGLTYFNLKDYDKALAHAKVAYGMGFPLPGLRKLLEGVNAWK